MCPQLLALCLAMIAAAVAMFIAASVQRAAATRDVPADRARNNATILAGVVLLAMAGGVFVVILVRCLPHPTLAPPPPPPATEPAVHPTTTQP